MNRYDLKFVKEYNSKEARIFLEKARLNRFYPLFALAICYGMTRCEILNMEWKDIDFEKNKITIYTSHDIEKRNGEGKSCKGAFKRVYPLIPEIKRALLEEKDKQINNRNTVQNYNLEFENLVAIKQDGKPILRRTFSRNIINICKKNNLVLTDFSGLRNGCKSLVESFNDNQLINYWYRTDFSRLSENRFPKYKSENIPKLVLSLNGYLTQENFFHNFKRRKFQKEIEQE